MTPYRVVLADDHALLRQGLRRIVEGRGGMEVVGEAADGLQLLEVLKGLSPDMVVVDISMPRLRGIEAIREISVLYPAVKVLVLTMHRSTAYLRQAMSAGAHGYILKEDADEELFRAVESIRQGKAYVSRRLSEDVMDEWSRSQRGDTQPPPEADPLTPRERQVLKLIAEGKRSREIADLLFISVRTAEHHRTNIMDKLKLRNAADLVQYAVRKGYLGDQGVQ
ncbi:MAG TPA: response regulator transcription factor [Dissulfurispiraceae bacterium]|nr:response regulator transcription factor [Dissulfurispiraceae bacterium]